MNTRFFRLVFNRTRQMCVPVAESHCTRHGQPRRARASAQALSPPCPLKTLSLALALAFSPVAWANPQGGVVEQGQADFHTQGHTLTITNSPGAVIRWQDFSIGAHETTRFVQENAQSAVLNRIVGELPSHILGRLESNGQVWLINPNGVMFGQGAQVDVAGLVASSLTISAEDFAAGRGRFAAEGTAGAVHNKGHIQTGSGGTVILMAPQVENHGVIKTPEGQILLAAGHRVEIADLRNPALRLEIVAGETALNLGQLLAEGGAVALQAQRLVQAGEIRASHAQKEGGRIFLKGTESAALRQGSQTNADGQKGGRIDITADTVTLEGATVSAQGETQGGQVRIGGAFQGGKTPDTSKSYHEAFVGRWEDNAPLANARTTTVDKDSRILAGSQEGKGGTAVVWSDERTRMQGQVNTQGPQRGGAIEISSAKQMPGLDLSQVQSGGTLLLDPKNIVIKTDGANPEPPTGFEESESADTNISPTLVTGLLDSGNDVTLQANNDITVDEAISSSYSSSLTMEAGRSVLINADVTVGGDLTVVANAPGANLTHRDAGAGVIDQAQGTEIIAGMTETQALSLINKPAEGGATGDGDIIVGSNIVGGTVLIDSTNEVRSNHTSYLDGSYGINIHTFSDLVVNAKKNPY
jgi:filamentous hemagglutinin family protein